MKYCIRHALSPFLAAAGMTTAAYLFATPSDPDGFRARADRVARDDRSAALGVRLRDGDETALEEIIRLFRAPLAAFLRRTTSLSDADVDDVLQRVFYRAWVNRDALRDGAALRAYLFTAARHQALNHLRGQRHDRHVVPLEAASAVTRPVDADLHARDLAAAIYHAIEQLPPRGREIFLLSRDGGLSYPEIATATGTSINTVKTHMTRALAVLASAAAPFLD